MKLTKEQSEWFKERIKDLYFNNYPGSNDAHNYSLDVKDIINQCTEKEFPAFKFEVLSNEDEGMCTIDKPVKGSTADVKLELFNGELAFFNKKQFKRFAEGVNKIAEWIDEQAD